MAYRKEAQGIGGWLLVFLILYSGLAPLLELAGLALQFLGPGATYMAKMPTLATLRAVTTGQILFEVAIAWFIGYRLCRVFTPASVRLTIAALWLLGPMAVGAGMIARQALLGRVGSFAYWSPGLVAVGTQILLFAGVWTAYFLFSARVANTYYFRDEDNGLAATFA
jgi:hypothetical protein